MDVKPIFMFGPPRTGTTLLARLLAGANGVLSLSEPFHLHAILHRWALRGFFWDFQRRHGLKRVPWPNRCTVEGFLGFLRETAGANGLRYLVIKEVFHELGLRPPFCNLELLEKLAAGDAPVIAIHRHPRDAAASTLGLLQWLLGKHRGCIIRLLWPSVPRFRNDGHVIHWAAENWAHFADWTRQRGFFVVRYEDLVANPAEMLPRICDRVGLLFDQRMLDHHRHSPVAFGGIGDPKVLMLKARPVHDEAIGRGRNLTQRQSDSVKAACGTQAADFGYTL